MVDLRKHVESVVIVEYFGWTWNILIEKWGMEDLDLESICIFLFFPFGIELLF